MRTVEATVTLAVIDFGALVEPRVPTVAVDTLVPEAPPDDADDRLILRSGVEEAVSRLETLGDVMILIGPAFAGRAAPEGSAERIALVRDALGRADVPVVAWDAETERSETRHEPSAQLVRPADPAALAAALGSREKGGWLIVDPESDIPAWRTLGLTVIRLGPSPAGPLPGFNRPDHEARDLLEAANWILLQDTFGEVVR